MSGGEPPFGATRAPPFPESGVVWFNADRPPTLEALRGRPIVLEFWTYGCVNCQHLVPLLRRVESTFGGRVAVIGVHSPKFMAERNPDNVREAIARLGIAHPVLHDPERRLWDAYAIRAWPTLVFIAPDGRIVGQTTGEPAPDTLLDRIGRLLAGVEPAEPPAAARPAAAGGRFRFPTKIKPIPGPSRRWALADAGHHQIVVLDDKGAEVERYGAGEAGLEDGLSGEARFNGPQGLICDHDAVYVADTGNHAIRRIDLTGEGVATLAGTGGRGPRLPDEPLPGTRTALASPRDLAFVPGGLAVANAGTHQLGRLDLASGTLHRLAGSGAEGLRDGLADAAALAQPSGLAAHPDGRWLYFVDSESSAVRRLDLVSGEVVTLVGAGLFAFGHVNGPFEAARLQHPLGIAPAPDGGLLVADSYNGALRRLDLEAATVTDLGQDFACHDAVCRPLAEPAGVWPDGPDRVLAVDTNNHRVVLFDLPSRRNVTWAA